MFSDIILAKMISGPRNLPCSKEADMYALVLDLNNICATQKATPLLCINSYSKWVSIMLVLLAGLYCHLWCVCCCFEFRPKLNNPKADWFLSNFHITASEN